MKRGSAHLVAAAVCAAFIGLTAACTVSTYPDLTPIEPPGGALVGQATPTGSGMIEAVACGNALECTAVGQSPSTTSAVVDTTTNGGTTWRTRHFKVTSPTSFNSISCAGVHTCIAVGDSTSAGVTTGNVWFDGAGHWTQMTTPSTSTNLTSIACTTPDTCISLATNGQSSWSVKTDDAGRTWVKGGTLMGDMSDLACANRVHCVAVGYETVTSGQGDGEIEITEDAGKTWSTATIPHGTGLLHGVACPSTQFCIVVGTTASAVTDVTEAPAAVLTSTNGGFAWIATHAPTSVNDAFSVSCPHLHTSAVTGTLWQSGTPTGGVSITTDAGRSWRNPDVRYAPVSLTGVASATAAGCVTVGDDVLGHMALPRT